MYQPFNQYQPYAGLIQVNGIEGARAYRMQPNQAVALFDTNEDVLYVKATDGAGFPTIRTFSFTEVNPEPKACDLVTRSELDELKGAIEDVKQLVLEAGKLNNQPGNQHDEGRPAAVVQLPHAEQPAVPQVRQ